MKVERADGATDTYPKGDGFFSKDGELTVNDDKDGLIAVYAKGTWIRAYSFDVEQA